MSFAEIEKNHRCVAAESLGESPIGSEQEEAPGNLLPGLLRGLIPPARPGIPSALPRYL
jgi:hypothetical protein